MLVLEYFRILEIKKLPRSVPWWAQDTRARQACLACPGGLCPPRTPSVLCFSPVCLSSKIKNLYILPEPVNHRIAEKSSVLFSYCFRSDLSIHPSCLPAPPTTWKKMLGAEDRDEEGGAHGCHQGRQGQGNYRRSIPGGNTKTVGRGGG